MASESSRDQQRKKLQVERKEIIRVASVNESGTRIERLANLMLIDSFNKKVRKFKRGNSNGK